MGTPNERIIMIKGDAGKWYNQAIFIVNKDLPAGKIPVDFVAEAEKIINSYLEKKHYRQPLQTRKPHSDFNSVPVKRAYGAKRYDFAINMCMALGCLMLVAALTFGLLR